MTFRIITRGAPRPIASEFWCPLHGHFTAVVDSGTDHVECRLKLDCRQLSPWSPSRAPVMRMARVQARRGRDEKPEHPEWDFTRNLEEGQDPDDWQADRDAAHEERRKEWVTELARSD